MIFRKILKARAQEQLFSNNKTKAEVPITEDFLLPSFQDHGTMLDICQLTYYDP